MSIDFSESWFHHLKTGGKGMLLCKAIEVLLNSVSLRNISKRTHTHPEMGQRIPLLFYTHLLCLRDGLPFALFFTLLRLSLSQRFITQNGSKVMNSCSFKDPFIPLRYKQPEPWQTISTGHIYSFFHSWAFVAALCFGLFWSLSLFSCPVFWHTHTAGL